MPSSYNTGGILSNSYAKVLLYAAAVVLPLAAGYYASTELNNSAYFGGGVGASTIISIAAPSLKKLLS